MVNSGEYTLNEKSAEQNNRFKWIQAAFILIIIILVIVIGVLSAYVDINGKTFCTTKECLQSAAALKSTMDLNIDPCDNFYKFVCNKFEEVNLGHVDPLGEYTNFRRITNRINHLIKKYLTKPINETDPAPVKLVKDFYAACTNTTKRDELGYSVMDKYLLKAGLPKIPTIFTLPKNAWHTYSFDWVKTAVGLKKIFNIDLLFNVYKDKDKIYLTVGYRDPTNELGHLSNLESVFYRLFREHLAFNKNSLTISPELKQSVKDIISEVLGRESNVGNFTEILDEVSDAIRNMIVDVYLAKKRVGGGKGNYIRENEIKNITLADLQHLTNVILREKSLPPVAKGKKWNSFLNTLFKEITEQNLNLRGNHMVSYYEEELLYIAAPPALLSIIPDVMLEMYAWWKAVSLMIAHTTDRVSKSSTDLSSLDDCTNLAAQHFTYAIISELITKEFLTETKPNVEELVENLRDVFFERIQTIECIDDDVRKIAIKKLKATKVFVGAPDWIINKTRVMDEYSTLQIRNDSHLDNLMQITRRSVNIYEIEAENDTGYYGIVNIVDAYYYPPSSSIHIPWSVLNVPVYHLGLESLNYGALGIIIGHEIAHGFYGIGRFFDDHSNFRNWWSPQTFTNFKEKSECFVDQYANFTKRIGNKEHKINGVKTLIENIADNGGIRIAYHALQRYLKKRGKEYQLPGLVEFTSEQLFFLSVAYDWCISEGSEHDQMISQIDEHSPNDIRVNAIVQNTPEFSEAFNCPLGSRMNPRRKRCDMWYL